MDTSKLQQLNAAYERVNVLYSRLLNRSPTSQELNLAGGALTSKLGMLKQLITVGFSKEARSRRGWLGRLLRCAEASSAGPVLIRKMLCRPAIRTLEAFEFLRPGVSGDFDAIVSPTNDGHPSNKPNDLEVPTPALTIVGYLSSSSGLGEAARSLGLTCIESGIPVAGLDVSNDKNQICEDGLPPFPTLESPPKIDLLYVNADRTVPTRKLLDMAGHPRNHYSIGFWHWEQPVFPATYAESFAVHDEIWVPSTFVQDAIADVSPLPVFKVPHAISFTTSKNATREHFGLPRDKQLVLLLFNFYSCYQRKNPLCAIAAFREAARQAPSLGLVVKTQNGCNMPKEFNELKESLKDIPNATLIDASFSRQETWDLEACCDILLSLHRAEGFGLGPAEMMFLGKPVVATGWSANMDFMNSENSMPVRYELKPLLEHLPPYITGPSWAEADPEHAAWCLVRLAQDPALVQQMGNRAQDTVQRMLAPAVVGKRVADRLKLIASWLSEHK